MQEEEKYTDRQFVCSDCWADFEMFIKLTKSEKEFYKKVLVKGEDEELWEIDRFIGGGVLSFWSVKNWCLQNGFQINGVYSDIASGTSYENCNEFFKLLDEVFKRRVEKVIITYKDRLSRIGFELFYHLFKKFGTKIVIISEFRSEKLDLEEIFEKIVSLLHCYSMKLYNRRKNPIIQQLITQENEQWTKPNKFSLRELHY